MLSAASYGPDLLGLALPFGAILFARLSKFRSA
jgi:hypothetical protein